MTDETETRDSRGRWWSFTWPPLALAGGLGALELLRGKLQHRQMFLPEEAVDAPDLAEAALELEDRWIETSDGVKLHAWWSASGSDGAPVLLFCHGQTGDLHRQLGSLERIVRNLDADVLAFDYRGYGRSAGTPSERGLYLDVRAAFRHLVEELGVDPRRIVLFGHSLGGAVAIDGALDLPAAGLVAQATFTQMRDMARAFYPGVPLHLLTRNHFRSVEKVPRIDLPKLFVHGDRDEKIPPAIGHDLFLAAAEPKEELIVPGAGHSDLFVQGGDSYWGALREFLGRVTGS